uniref:Uncharacterized protein n=1 Tax=Solanum lycopersicum TaxID=4081 RepID=K4BU39_SOLLC
MVRRRQGGGKGLVGVLGVFWLSFASARHWEKEEAKGCWWLFQLVVSGELTELWLNTGCSIFVRKKRDMCLGVRVAGSFQESESRRICLSGCCLVVLLLATSERGKWYDGSSEFAINVRAQAKIEG